MKKSAAAKFYKKKWFIGGAVALVAALVIGFSFSGRKGRGIEYKPAPVVRGDVRNTILSTGTVAPRNRLDLKAPVAGRIEKVLVQEGQKVRPGQILAWMSSTERAALIDTARAKGKEELKYWEDSYKMTPILAPGRGLVILKNVDIGQTVTQTDTILSLSDHLIVKANVDETDLAQVVEGQRVELTLDAFPGKPLEAKVEHIGYDAKTVSNVTTYEVDVVALDTPEFMKSGMTANVTFVVAAKDDTLLLPAAAVHRENHESYVLVNAPDHREPVRMPVKVGISDGKKVEVLEGVEEGQTVLVPAVRAIARQKGDGPTSPFGMPRAPRK